MTAKSCLVGSGAGMDFSKFREVQSGFVSEASGETTGGAPLLALFEKGLPPPIVGQSPQIRVMLPR